MLHLYSQGVIRGTTFLALAPLRASACLCAQVSYQELSAISQIKSGARRVVVNNTQGDRTFGGRLAALSLTDPDIKRTLNTGDGVNIVGLGVGGSSIGFCAPPGLSITVPRANHFIGKS